MSTRSNIVIENGKSKIYLYRHHDGYLAETGADLYRKLVAARFNAGEFLQSLIDDRYDGYGSPKPVYELTSEIHGDIEFLYRVVFKRSAGKRVSVGYSEFKPGSERPSSASKVEVGKFDAFRKECNEGIAYANSVIAEWNSRQLGGKSWALKEVLV